MPHFEPDYWSERVRQAFERYHESLSRLVAGRLYRPRSHWPLPELIERTVASLGNAATVDRRLSELDAAARKLLALMAHSRQPRWKSGNLVEMLAVLGHSDGMGPVLSLMDEGLLYPEWNGAPNSLKGFEQWMCQAGAAGYSVFSHPHVLSRAAGIDLGLAECPGIVTEVTQPREADGLDWPLRLAVVWQQTLAGPMRQTQQGEFFKRDLERLRTDALLNAPFDSPVGIPDPALFATALARLEGLLVAGESDLRAGALPEVWNEGLWAALGSLWSALPQLETWNGIDGWRDLRFAANPYPSAFLIAVLLLARLPTGAWARPSAIEDWIINRHPYWEGRGRRSDRAASATNPTESVLAPYLLGLGFHLRVIQVAKDHADQWVARLTDTGRWLIGIGPQPSIASAHPKTLLVQPNLEIVAYRQGLTPGVIASLSRFASWKSLGAACTLQLGADAVYRALESGLSYESILKTLEQHGTRPPPPSVLESLRTWADKRDRLQIYSAAALFEFNTPEEAEAAIARGLPALRISERLLLVSNERMIDYRHFRLIGTRDYSLPPDQCVDVDADGVTLTIDPARSDLLLETELHRFAEPLNRVGANGRRQFRLTPRSLAAGRERGVNAHSLEEWFMQRTGRSLTPAGRLLLTGPLLGPCEFQRRLVLEVETEGLADGLIQWPGTRALIDSRLGPTALVVAEENVETLRERLRELGMQAQ